MGIDDAQESRLISRGMPGDDPTWGEVSAFLETVDSAYADIRTTDLAAGHLAAVSREVRLIRGELQHGRKKTMKDLFTLKTHRILAGSVAAAVIALTAGVGVASAMPGGPLAHLVPAAPAELTPTPAPVTPSEAPVASAHESDPSDDADEPDATSPTTPSPKPSARHTENESDDDSSDGSEARDGEKKASHADPSDSGDDSEEADDSEDSGDDESASSEHSSGGSDDNESGDDNGSDHGDGSTDD